LRFTVPASGTPSAWHFNLLAGDRVIGRQPSVSSRLYYHRDLLNSTRAVVSGTTVVESRDYDPWGVELAGRTLGSGTKEGFTGQERNAESGVDALWARGYLSALGRWGGVDPARDSFPTWTPYNYVENNPLSRTDPLGLCSVGGDYTYDQCGNQTGYTETGGPDRHFMQLESGRTVQLDGRPIGGATPYRIILSAAALNRVAKAIADNEDTNYGIEDLKRASQPGADLDFKPDIYAQFGTRTRWNAGAVGEVTEMYVHGDKVGNVAWARYVNTKTAAWLGLALWGARGQAEQAGALGENLDQLFIRRGWRLP
jgi:RHS repeat-associated protein